MLSSDEIMPELFELENPRGIKDHPIERRMQPLCRLSDLSMSWSRCIAGQNLANEASGGLQANISSRQGYSGRMQG